MKGTANLQGFSLVELLLVVAIVGLLSVFAISGFNQTVRGTKIASTAQGVSDALGLARNSALARNRPVQVRFYKLPDFNANSGDSPQIYRGLQIFVCDTLSTNALTKPYLFPDPVVASTDSRKSSLLQQTEVSDSTVTNVGGFRNHRYVAVTFGSDGIIRNASAQLTTTNQWFITVQTKNDLATDATFPNNFATISVNPVTGNTKVYQPR